MKILSFTTFTILIILCTFATSQLIRMPLTKPHTKKVNNIQNQFLDFFQLTPGSIGIHDYSDSDYIGTISIGTPAREFKVLLDTGSAQLWIPDASIASTVVDSFNCSNSQTCASMESEVLHISYGTGGLTGFVFTDDLHLGNLTVPNFRMLAATNISGVPDQYYDGIMGLGIGRFFPELPTVLEAMTSSGVISVGAFSMYLGRNLTSEGDVNGEIIFGGYDPKYAATDFQFVNVENGNTTFLWEANMTALGLGQDLNVSDVENFYVIFDSGTSYTLFPQSFIENVVEEAASLGVNCNFNGSYYICDCNGSVILPDMFFYFDNATFSVPASSFILPQDNKCFLAMQALDNSTMGLRNPAVLGDVFLKNYYGLYTQDNCTVGFARVPIIENDSGKGTTGFSAIFIALLILIIVLGYNNN